MLSEGDEEAERGIEKKKACFVKEKEKAAPS
jgi:hypothetical protein